MRRKNIDYIISMTKDFIDGNLDCLTYCLDYNHELIQRWDKMTRESPELADMVNFYLFESGFDTVNCEYRLRCSCTAGGLLFVLIFKRMRSFIDI